MALASIDDLIAGMCGTQPMVSVSKASITSTATGNYYSLWRSGDLPAAAAIPGTAETCTRTMLGAFGFPDATVGSNRLIFMSVHGQVRRNYILTDRLAHMGGLSGTTTSSQTVGVDVSSLTTRIGASDYSEVEWWLEWYTGSGGSSVSATVTYTNAAGTAGRTTTVTIPSSPLAGRLVKIVGSSGEKIKSIQSISHASTGTANTYGVTASKIIASLSTHDADTRMVHYSPADTLLAKIPNGAALNFHVMASASATSAFTFYARVIDR